MSLHAQLVEPRRVTERIVAADGDQVIQLQCFDVLEDAGGHVVCLAVLGKILIRQERRQLLHFRRIRAAGVQKRTASAVYIAGVLAIQREDVTGGAFLIVEVDVSEPFPAAADADDFAVALRGPVNNAFND